MLLSYCNTEQTFEAHWRHCCLIFVQVMGPLMLPCSGSPSWTTRIWAWHSSMLPLDSASKPEGTTAQRYQLQSVLVHGVMREHLMFASKGHLATCIRNLYFTHCRVGTFSWYEYLRRAHLRYNYTFPLCTSYRYSYSQVFR